VSTPAKNFDLLSLFSLKIERELQRQLQDDMQEKLSVERAFERLLGESYSKPSEDDMAAEMLR
jgi:hypothetical protein